MIKSIKILGKKYRIKVTNKKGGDLGECFSEQCLIEIAKHQCKAQKRDTLLHEVTHGIDHEMNTSIKEKQIRGITTGLLDTLRRNKKLTKYLLGKK